MVRKMGTTEELANWIYGLRYEDIPPQVRDSAKTLLLDNVGVMMSGVNDDVGRIVPGFVKDIGGVPECSVVGAGFRTSAPNAAFANGALGHAIDFDDISFSGHPTVGVLPAALALGEKLGRSGKEVLTALVVGLEVYGKLGLAAQFKSRSAMFARGWHSPTIFGLMGATAASAKILGLNVDEIRTAFGIVGSEASGLKANVGTMGKPFQIGHGSRSGVVAALLAKAGLSADTTVFEHPYGFAHAFFEEGSYDLDMFTRDLGKPFRLEQTGVTIKKYPCCGCNHKFLDTILEMVNKYDIDRNKVKSIKADISSYQALMLGYSRPETGYQGKFSLQYNLASAVLDRKVDRSTFSMEKGQRPELRKLIEKVTVVPHSEWKPDPGSGAKDPSPIEIELDDGRVYKHEAEILKGSPEFPLTKDELLGKLRENAKGVLTEADTERSIKLLMEIESLSDIGELMSVLSKTG